MEPLFKNVTIYNSENYNQFIEFHGKKFSFSYNSYNIIMFILLSYCIILNIVEKNIPILLLFISLTVLLFFIRIYWPTKRYEKTQKKYAENKESTCTTFFYKSYFSIEENTFHYLRLYKIFETTDYFYLYIDDENAVLVSKSGFEIGTVEEFTKFIKKKCLLKYSKQK